MQIEASNQIHARQKTIQSLERENSQLRSQNADLENKYRQAEARANQYYDRYLKDPFYNILEGVNFQPQIQRKDICPSYQSLQKSLQICQQKLKHTTVDVNSLRNLLRKQTEKTQSLSRQYNKYKTSQQQLRIQNNRLESQIKTLRENNQKLLDSLRNQQRDFEDFRQHALSIKAEIIAKEQSTQRELENYSLTLNQFASSLDKIHLATQSQNRENEQKPYDLVQKFKKQQEIMEDMGAELDFRNEEIAKLLKEGKSITQPQSFYSSQHTLKRAKNQANEWKRIFEDLSEKLYQLQKKYQESIKEKSQLEKEYKKALQQITPVAGLNQQNKKMKKQITQLQNKHKQSEQRYLQLSQQTIYVLQENQALTTMIQNYFGSRKSSETIQNALDAYYRDRDYRKEQGKDRWGNVNELIEMNLKLRKRIQSGR